MTRLFSSALLVLSLALPLAAQQPHRSLSPRTTTPTTSIKTPTADRRHELPAHRTCSAMEIDSARRAASPALGTLVDFEGELRRAMAERSSGGLMSRVVYRIPVVVHVVHNGESVGSGTNVTATQVASQIDALNEDFRRKQGTPGDNVHPAGVDSEIEFYLAPTAPDGRPLDEPGIDRYHGGRREWSHEAVESTLKPNSIWSPERYMNIWVVRFESSAKLLGYAQFPTLSGLQGLNQLKGAETDGVVVNYLAFGRIGTATAPYDGGRTLTHEIGHFLGLRHIWGDGDCSVDDYCDDTPNAGEPNYTCDVPVNSCPEGDRDMVENYMDYTTDGCMSIFTADQRDRMRTVLERSPRRRELILAQSDPTDLPPLARFSTDNGILCEGSTITLKDASLGAPTSWTWTVSIDGAHAMTFHEQNPTVTLSRSGVWDIELEVANDNGRDEVRIDNAITTLPATTRQLPIIESIEEDENLIGWSVLNPDDDRTWSVREGAGSAGGRASITMDNFSLDSDPTGTIDALVSARVDFGRGAGSELAFDVAYAEYAVGSFVVGDTLAVLASTDCGGSWQTVWAKAGNDLATAEQTDQQFVPGDGEWRRERVALDMFAGTSGVQLAIVNISGWGNNVYVDNIELVGGNGPSSVALESTSAVSMSVAPSPAVSTIELSMSLAAGSHVSIDIVDARGNGLLSIDDDVTAGRSSKSIDVASFAPGAYTVRVVTAAGTALHRFIKQ